MTRHCFFLAALILAGSVFGVCAQVPDPTRVASPLGDVLRAQMTELRSLTLAGLVAADGDSGIALIQSEDGKTDVVRPGATLALQASGIPLRINVLGVSEKGVEIEAPALEETWMLPVSFTRSRRLGSTQALSEDVLAYVEFNRVPLGLALRLLADQSRQNYVATEAAAKVPVSLFLRDVTPEEVVEELCKSYGLWYRVGDGGHTPTTRILTMAEFQSNLASQQTGELSETFTLLYPNVTEIAAIIQGIYADRVYLSLGDEDILEDDLNDLSRRFERFNMINNSSGSSLLGNFNLQNNRGYGQSRRNGGIYSRNRDGTWDSVRDQAAERRLEEATLRDLQVEDADRIQQAMEAGNDGATNLVEILQDLQRRPASVYVTVSRRNNMLVVRTGDPRVMEDIRSLVRQLDVPTPMVLLELKILELNLTDQLNTVFDYTATGDFRVNGDDTAWGAVFPAASSQEKAMSFQLISEHFTARVQLLQERGDAKLIATPTLLTANNEVSQLFIGKEVPIIRNVTSQTIVTENNIVTTPETEIQFERVGTMLLITPNINADRTVTLRLLQENSALAAEKSSVPVLNSTSGQIQYVPVDVVESRSISGTFVAGDRAAIAVGGLIREEQSHMRSGIPFLMDIPLLGWFFRTTQRVTARTELVILITPYVISTPSESGEISKEWLERNTWNPGANPFLPEESQIQVNERTGKPIPPVREEP